MLAATARPVPIAQAYEAPQHRCIALAVEGMHFYEKAVEFDHAGNVKEAAFYFNRAVPKLAEAGQLCPNGHPDKQALADLSQDIPLRVVYLESLAGAHATVPLEDHIGEVKLVMDLSSPPPAGEEQAQVSELLARSGISGSAADLSDEGLRLVRALEKQSELRVFVDRMLVSDGRRRTAAATPNDVDACIAAVPSFDGLFKSLRLQPWVELNIDEKADRASSKRPRCSTVAPAPSSSSCPSTTLGRNNMPRSERKWSSGCRPSTPKSQSLAERRVAESIALTSS